MKLIKRFSSLSPIYSGGLTNHVPMMITALHKMGVSKSDIELICENYVRENEIPDLHDQYYPNIPFEDEYISLTNKYINVILEFGIDKTVHDFLQDMQFSLESGLYHGLIRLYYALLQGKDELLVAQALSYFYLMSKEYIVDGSYKTSIDSFTDLVEYRKNLDYTFKSFVSLEKFEELLEIPGISSRLFRLEDISNKENQLVDLFVKQFLQTRDFYILHVITGFQALHALKCYFDDYEDVLNMFFTKAQVLMVLNDYKEIYTEILNESDFSDPIEIGELQDAHDIKLLRTCYYLRDELKNEEIKKVISYLKEKTSL